MTGYELNAVQSALSWTKDGLEFRVIGPYVVLFPTEADALYQSFSHKNASGPGDVSLTETRTKDWNATLSWPVPHGYDRADFQIVGANTDLVRVVWEALHRTDFARPAHLRCSVRLKAALTAIHDQLSCPSLQP